MGDYGWKDKGRGIWGKRGKEEVGEREGGEARGKRGEGGDGGKEGNGSGPDQVLEEIDAPGHIIWVTAKMNTITYQYSPR